MLRDNWSKVFRESKIICGFSTVLGLVPLILYYSRVNCIYKEMYYKELAHTVIEAEKSHDLPSTSWRPGKIGGIIQSETSALRTRGANGVHPSPRTGEDEMSFPSSIREAGKGDSSFFRVCSRQAFDRLDGDHPQWEGQSTSLSPWIQMLILSATPSQTPRSNVYSGHP